MVHSLVSATVHWVYLQIFLSQVPQELILVTAPKLQEDWIGTLTGIGYCSLGLLTDIPLTGAARVNPGHGTKIARGLDWYTH